MRTVHRASDSVRPVASHSKSCVYRCIDGYPWTWTFHSDMKFDDLPGCAPKLWIGIFMTIYLQLEGTVLKVYEVLLASPELEMNFILLI